MPLPLNRDQIAGRIRDYPRDSYLFIGSVIKGVALAAATFV